MSKRSYWRCPIKKASLKTLQNSQENTCVGVCFLNRTQVFSCEFCEFSGRLLLILENSFRKVENSPGQFHPDHTPSDEFCPENPPRYVSNQCVSLSGIICMSLVFGLQVAYNRLKPEQDLAFARDGKRYFHLLKATFMIIV